MNSLLESRGIHQMDCGSNFSYILSDNSDFMPTEYKVLQSQKDSCFVPCMKMLYNGQVQMYYLPRNLKPFSLLVGNLDAEGFLTIVTNLFTDIIDVWHNGFLSCQNIDISFDHIYVDPSTYKVKLVYLPLSERIYSQDSIFENDVRTGLVKLISSLPGISCNGTMQLSAMLSNGMLSMENICVQLRTGKQHYMPNGRTVPGGMGGGNGAKASYIRLIAVNSPVRVELEVTKEHFIIGKRAAIVDGVISFNENISRKHCCIDSGDSGCTVTDLGSANGTYVNRVRLVPNHPHILSNGDVLRLANSDFQVKIQ